MSVATGHVIHFASLNININIVFHLKWAVGMGVRRRRMVPWWRAGRYCPLRPTMAALRRARPRRPRRFGGAARPACPHGPLRKGREVESNAHKTEHDTTHERHEERCVPARCRVGIERKRATAVRRCSSSTCASGISVGSNLGNLPIIEIREPRIRVR